MKILIVSQYFYPENFRINDLALGLRERGHEVKVLTGFPNYPGGTFFNGYGLFGPYRETYNGVEIIRAPLFTRGKRKSFRLVINYFSYALSASILGPFRLREHFDVIFVYQISPVTVGVPALVMKFFRKCPIVFWAIDLWPQTLVTTKVLKSKLLISCVRRLVTFLYKFSDRILVSSPGFVKPVLEHNIKPEKITVWPQWAENFYERKVFKDQELPYSEIPKGFVVMFAGNLGTSQSLETVIEAATLLRHQSGINWVILGDGYLKPWLEKQIKERKLESVVHLLGTRPPTAMPAYFYLADALLVSYRQDPLFDLNIPAKFPSYLAASKPILASLDGVVAKIVNESQCGYVSEAGDPEGLASSVLKMYSLSQSERKEMGQRGFHYYKANFDREMLFTKLEDIMLKLQNQKQISESQSLASNA